MAETAEDIFGKLLEIGNWSLCKKDLIKGLSKNSCCVDLCDIENTSYKLEPASAFQNTKAAFKRCSTKIVVQQNVMKYSPSNTIGQKQESFTLKFTKNWSPFFKEFNHNFKTMFLINTSRWQLLSTIIFWENSWMADPQRQRRRYIHFQSYG